MGALSSLYGAKAWIDRRPWLKVEDTTNSPQFCQDLIDLFELALTDAGHPLDALMFRSKACDNLFYFTPEAMSFFERRVGQLTQSGKVLVDRRARPMFYGLRLDLVAGTEVFWF